MELYDIVEAASSNIKNGELVLHRSMKVHTKFKVYKRFCYDLYVVKGKEKTCIKSFEEVKNSPADDLVKVWNGCDKLYLRELIKWFASEEYKTMMEDGV